MPPKITTMQRIAGMMINQVLKPKFSGNDSDVWHGPLLLDNNITEDPNTEGHQLVTVMLAPAEDQYKLYPMPQ